MWTPFGPAQGCNVNINFEDHVIQGCGAEKKIIRTWYIRDWCDNRDTVCVQYIKVVDRFGPVLLPVNLEKFDPLALLSLDMDGLFNEMELERLAEEFDALIRKLFMVVEADPHTCKALVDLPDIRPYIYDCSDFDLQYEITVIPEVMAARSRSCMAHCQTRCICLAAITMYGCICVMPVEISGLYLRSWMALEK